MNSRLLRAITCAAGMVLAAPTMPATAHSAIGPDALRDQAVADRSSGGVTPSADPDDWSQFRFGPRHLGHNSAESILSPANVNKLRVAWTAWTGFNSSPAVVDGVVYVGSGNGDLNAYAVDCGSGGMDCAPLWTGNAGWIIDWSSPAVVDDVVYVGSGDGLYAFPVDCASGGGSCEPLWTAPGDVGYDSPTVSQGVVYVGDNDGYLYAYQVGCRSDGGACSPLWRAWTGGEVHSSPAVAGGFVYIGGADGNLYAFAVGCNSGGGTCTPVWTGSIGARTNSSPAVTDTAVYIGSDDGNLYAFAVGCNSGGGTCAPVWTGAIGSVVFSSPAVAGGTVYVGASDGRLYAFAVACNSGGGTCSPLWKSINTGDGGSIVSSPAIANGVVYVGSQGADQRDGSLYAFKVGCSSGGGTCQPLWESPSTGWMINSSPAISNGAVYVASNDGRLYAFTLGGSSGVDTTPPTVTKPRPSERVPGTLGSGTSLIAWSGWDAGSGIDRFRLQQRLGSGPYKGVPLPSRTSTTVSIALPLGVMTQFRVRAVDAAGNVSAWKYGPAFTPVLRQDTYSAVKYQGGTWHRVSSATASGGSTTYSTALGASARLKFTGRTIAVVAPLGPTRGDADVLVDGVVMKTVNLYSAVPMPRQVVFNFSWSSVGTHTIRVIVDGTPGHPRVDLDTFVVFK